VSEVTATYYFRPRKMVSPEEAVRAILTEETTGSWTGKAAVREPSWVRKGVIGGIEPSGKGYQVSIHLPSEIFEPGNIAQYLSVVAGNLFGLSELESVRLLDLRLPDELVPFHGPKFGISGIRRLIGTIDRPHIGTIIKPNIGLSPEETAAVAYQAAIGGADLIIDDGLLTDQQFCPLNERVPLVMDRLDAARTETGQQTLYAVNITAMPDSILERAEGVVDRGANMVMVNVLAAGYGALQILAREPGLKVPVHVHRTMHAAMTRNPEQGMAMLPIARLVRMLGGDQLHIGSVSGRMRNVPAEVTRNRDALTAPEFGHRRAFPVVSGGINPGNVAEEMAVLGKDIMILAGVGAHGHPDGTAAGMRALRQSVDACMAGISPVIYAKEHYELERALKFFGNTRSRG
jgi:ribulose-bisphosphate carboxylase large chain